MGNSLWLMSVGVFYLVAVSYDNIEGILMDALTFEVIFDVEAKYYQWTMGAVHDRLLEEESESSETSNKDDTDFNMFFWPCLRMFLGVGFTYTLDRASIQVARSSTHDTLISWGFNQTASL